MMLKFCCPEKANYLLKQIALDSSLIRVDHQVWCHSPRYPCRYWCIHLPSSLLNTFCACSFFESSARTFLYFSIADAISDSVHAKPPYAAKRGKRDTTNSSDGIFRRGGRDLMLQVTPSGEAYSAAYSIGLVME